MEPPSMIIRTSKQDKKNTKKKIHTKIYEEKKKTNDF